MERRAGRVGNRARRAGMGGQKRAWGFLEVK